MSHFGATEGGQFDILKTSKLSLVCSTLNGSRPGEHSKDIFMYEVETKIELTIEEKQQLLWDFKGRGFLSEGITPQNDFYVEAKKSPHGGYDLKRYREESGKFIYTEKIWEIVDGQPVRRENEHGVSEKEFRSTIAQFPDALKIIKDREWYACKFRNVDISVTIDSIKFDHSKSMRYFIEAEIDVQDKKDVTKAKNLIKDFLKDILKRSEIVEAPGMFTMAFEKL